MARTNTQLLRTTNKRVGMKKTPYGEIRVAPKVSGGTASARDAAERAAGYATDIAEARATAADMLRRNRASGGKHFDSTPELKELNLKLDSVLRL